MEVVHKLLIDLTASRSMTILYLYGLINVETRFVTYSCSGLLLENYTACVSAKHSEIYATPLEKDHDITYNIMWF